MAVHTCFACSPNNPERIVHKNGDNWIVNFPARFLGPPNAAQGGIAVGALTCLAQQAAMREGIENPISLTSIGRFILPIPLAVPLNAAIVREDHEYSIRLEHNEKTVLDGRVKVADIETKPGTLLQAVPKYLEDDLRQVVNIDPTQQKNIRIIPKDNQSNLNGDDPWANWNCFGCSGKKHALKISHKIAGPDLTFSPWETEPHFSDEPGKLALTITAAALDCPTMHAASAHEPGFIERLAKESKTVVTGTYSIQFLRQPPVEAPGGLMVGAKYKNRDGRKLFGVSVLFDSNKTVYAVGEAVSLIVNIPGR